MQYSQIGTLYMHLKLPCNIHGRLKTEHFLLSPMSHNLYMLSTLRTKQQFDMHSTSIHVMFFCGNISITKYTRLKPNNKSMKLYAIVYYIYSGWICMRIITTLIMQCNRNSPIIGTKTHACTLRQDQFI